MKEINFISCLVGFGSNLGDRAAMIATAVAALQNHDAVRFIEMSSLIETLPVGGPAGQGNYFNCVAHLETSLAPRDFLELLLQIETQLGRTRTQKWESRVIDLDLLLYGDLVCDFPDLTIPHPRLHNRYFVLAGAAQIAPTRIHPILKKSMRELFDELPKN